MKRTRIVSRNFEMVLGIVGSVIGLFSGSMLLFLGALGNIPTPFLGFVAIAASFLGIISSFYVKKNNEAAGIGIYWMFSTELFKTGLDEIIYKNLDDKTFKEHGKDFLNNFGLSSLQFLFSSSYDEFSNNWGELNGIPIL